MSIVSAAPTRANPGVLFVGVGAPWNGGAGYLARQNMFLAALAECAPLTLAMIDHGPEDGYPPFECGFTPLPGPGQRREPDSGLADLIGDLLSPLPKSLRDVDPTPVRRQVEALDPDRFDAVFAYRIDFAHFAGVIGHPRLILDIDDPEHLRQQSRLKVCGAGWREWHAWFDLARLRRFERRAARRALASFVCQANDQAAFAEPRPRIVPNCVDAPATCPVRNASEPSILFVGNLEGGPHSPNVDALVWFLDCVWRLVRRESPDSRFRIVGRLSDQLRARLAHDPGVVAEGFVDDLDRTFANASLSVAPIRFGTGTRIKILESMARGCPVVSTPKGCEGIEVSHGRELLIGATPEDLARHCLVLLSDAQRQCAISRRAFELVKRSYDRARVHVELVRLLREILDVAVQRRTGPRGGGRRSPVAGSAKLENRQTALCS